MIITTNLEIIDNSTNHTLIILPANIRTLILDASDDIRYNDPKVHRQLVDERIKQVYKERQCLNTQIVKITR